MSLASIVRHPRRWRYQRARERLAARFVIGEGIEIGALHSPFPGTARGRIRYVDRLSTSELRAEYPELSHEELVDVEVVDDGETLASLDDASQDFVIASHFLEHCEDPIGTLAAHLRVLRPGGVVVLALPDRLRGVDHERQPTALEHLTDDHAHGPVASRARHYSEWARLVDLPRGNVTPEDVHEHAAVLERRRASIHFHCWTAAEFGAQLRRLIAASALPARIVYERENFHEFLVVIRRVPDSAA
jgi:SAM-dependent methyltransferase